jgi:hypothetical protein
MEISTNWIIISPGRTGSRFIADVYSIFYKELFGVDARYMGPGTEFDQDAHWQMFHTHDPTFYTRHRAHARCILSTRDMVEAALSYCIVDRTKLYHVFGSTQREEIPDVEPFHLSLDEFMEQYSYQISFYKQVRDIIDEKTVVVRYKSIMEDWRCVLWDSGFSPDNITAGVAQKVRKLAPLKNSWNNKAWISNWDELESCVKNLPRNPDPFYSKNLNKTEKDKTEEVKTEGEKHE